MKQKYVATHLLAISALSIPITGIAADQKATTTTQLAAEAKKREGQTGTSNQAAAKQLKALEAEEKQTAKPPAKAASK